MRDLPPPVVGSKDGSDDSGLSSVAILNDRPTLRISTMNNDTCVCAKYPCDAFRHDTTCINQRDTHRLDTTQVNFIVSYKDRRKDYLIHVVLIEAEHKWRVK